ncbi:MULTISPECIES: Pycsar system effector family protein [unclassified Lentimonas]|uniref:Pycsar system effector family protein n=1 Tax=unclassified Lentimonas TaxID=2630993 RepID=UPI00132BC72B|nr:MULTISPECIES: Pycsar system effector family protein [unclassified Lentimonas]CAA6677071.1 Unannotated [Lentimonas sp. CC4]CAA6687266.1 Unannotated [Lentimonas sp. CC6]CAA7074335.1 Unannotated [Lentimonas sp. CC4]CAA7171433.1 Unannotated [Lentimonas sp. CC21]CAA7180072.1 Unannotated [Lentimonas sp. CC8]
MNKTELLQEILNRQLNWIAAADSRIGLILPLSTVMLSVLAALSPDADSWTMLSAITSAISAILLFASIICAAIGSFPRTSGPKGSVVYFGGIVTRDNKEYSQAINDLSDEALQEDLANQCHRNAQIAGHKFSWVKRGMIALFASIIPWVFSVYSLYAN